MSRKATATAAAAVALSFLTACSSSPSADSPAGTAKSVLEAVSDSDYAAFCDLMTAEDRKKVEESSAKSCADGMSEVMKDETEKYEDIEIDESKVVVNGDQATVPGDAISYKGMSGKESDMPLVKRDGKWLLEFSRL
jgi:hypothetical protein